MAKLLEIDNLLYSTGDQGRQITVSAVLREGGILNVRGPSGSGKTTLLRTIARLRECRQGRVLLRDRSWTEFTAIEWRRKVHYLAQKPVIFDGSVAANLARPFELAAVKKEVRFDLARAQNLTERLFPSADILKQDARTLSGGEAARMCLIRALLVDPVLLLLDEPLAALDRQTAELVLELIAAWAVDAPGRGVVLVSHVGQVDKLPGLSVLEIGAEEGVAGE